MSKRNYRFLIVVTIVRLYFFGALALSFFHIQDAFGKLGSTGFEQAISPLGVDGMAVIGMLFRSEFFSAGTRRMGFWLQVPATLVSLIANVYAGNSAGGRIIGVIVVIGYVVTEIAVHRAEPAEADSRAEHEAAALAAQREADRIAHAEAQRLVAEQQAAAAAKAAESAKRSRAARKGARTRKANAAAKAQVDAIEISIEEAERVFAAADAPVSPAPDFRQYL